MITLVQEEEYGYFKGVPENDIFCGCYEPTKGYFTCDFLSVFALMFQ